MHPYPLHSTPPLRSPMHAWPISALQRISGRGSGREGANHSSQATQRTQATDTQTTPSSSPSMTLTGDVPAALSTPAATASLMTAPSRPTGAVLPAPQTQTPPTSQQQTETSMGPIPMDQENTPQTTTTAWTTPIMRGKSMSQSQGQSSSMQQQTHSMANNTTPMSALPLAPTLSAPAIVSSPPILPPASASTAPADADLLLPIDTTPVATLSSAAPRLHAAVRMFEQWHQHSPAHKHSYQPLDQLPLPVFLTLIGDWIRSLKKSNGDVYTPDSVYVYCSSLQRHIRVTHELPRFNLLDERGVRQAMEDKFGAEALLMAGADADKKAKFLAAREKAIAAAAEEKQEASFPGQTQQKRKRRRDRHEAIAKFVMKNTTGLPGFEAGADTEQGASPAKRHQCKRLVPPHALASGSAVHVNVPYGGYAQAQHLMQSMGMNVGMGVNEAGAATFYALGPAAAATQSEAQAQAQAVTQAKAQAQAHTQAQTQALAPAQSQGYALTQAQAQRQAQAGAQAQAQAQAQEHAQSQTAAMVQEAAAAATATTAAMPVVGVSANSTDASLPVPPGSLSIPPLSPIRNSSIPILPPMPSGQSSADTNALPSPTSNPTFHQQMKLLRQQFALQMQQQQQLNEQEKKQKEQWKEKQRQEQQQKRQQQQGEYEQQQAEQQEPPPLEPQSNQPQAPPSSSSIDLSTSSPSVTAVPAPASAVQALLSATDSAASTADSSSLQPPIVAPAAPASATAAAGAGGVPTLPVFKMPHPSHAHRTFRTEHRLLTARQTPSTPEGLLRCWLSVILTHMPGLSKTHVGDMKVSSFKIRETPEEVAKAKADYSKETGTASGHVLPDPAANRCLEYVHTSVSAGTTRIFLWEKPSTPHLCPVDLFKKFLSHRPRKVTGGAATANAGDKQQRQNQQTQTQASAQTQTQTEPQQPQPETQTPVQSSSTLQPESQSQPPSVSTPASAPAPSASSPAASIPDSDSPSGGSVFMWLLTKKQVSLTDDPSKPAVWYSHRRIGWSTMEKLISVVGLCKNEAETDGPQALGERAAAMMKEDEYEFDFGEMAGMTGQTNATSGSNAAQSSASANSMVVQAQVVVGVPVPPPDVQPAVSLASSVPALPAPVPAVATVIASSDTSVAAHSLRDTQMQWLAQHHQAIAEEYPAEAAVMAMAVEASSLPLSISTAYLDAFLSQLQDLKTRVSQMEAIAVSLTQVWGYQQQQQQQQMQQTEQQEQQEQQVQQEQQEMPQQQHAQEQEQPHTQVEQSTLSQAPLDSTSTPITIRYNLSQSHSNSPLVPPPALDHRRSTTDDPASSLTLPLGTPLLADEDSALALQPVDISREQSEMGDHIAHTDLSLDTSMELDAMAMDKAQQ